MALSDTVRLGTITAQPRAGWVTVGSVGDMPLGLGLTGTLGQPCLVVPTASAGLVAIPLATGGGGGGGPYLPLAGGTLSGTLTAPSFHIADDAAPADPLYLLDIGLTPDLLYLGSWPDSKGLTIERTTGTLYYHSGAGNYYRLLDERDKPAPQWSGAVGVTFSNVSSMLVPNAFTFPAGRFAVAPICTASVDSAAGNASTMLVRTYNRSPTNCGLIVNSANGSLLTGTFAIHLHARAAG